MGLLCCSTSNRKASESPLRARFTVAASVICIPKPLDSEYGRWLAGDTGPRTPAHPAGRITLIGGSGAHVLRPPGSRTPSRRFCLSTRQFFLLLPADDVHSALSGAISAALAVPPLESLPNG